MAQAGDLINWDNFITLTGTAWRGSRSIGYTGTYTYIVTAPAFHVIFKISGSGWWGYQGGSLYIYPYDEKTGKWGSAVYGSSQSGRGSSYSYTWSWKHNNSGGSSGDIHDCQIWKIVVYGGNNDGSKSGTLYYGGLECTTSATSGIYDNYFKGRLIYYSSCNNYCIGSGYTYSTEEACLKAQGYSVMRGTPISISTGTYKYITSKPL